MSLTKTQYNEIIRKYDEKKLRSQQILSEHLEEVYDNVPEVAEINDCIASLSVAYAKKLLSGNKVDFLAYKDDIKKLSNERTTLLIKNGYNENYITQTFLCDECKDSGYVNGKKCSCFKNEIVNILYEQSNIIEVLKNENFDTFTYDYYSDNGIDPATGVTSLQNMKKVVNLCREFIDTFDSNSTNLFLYGETGVGKSFLSNCIAKELIERSYSVIYLSAVKMFDILAKATFNHGNESYNTDYIMKHIYDCDLLIIDDLGTELTNSFTSSSLFNCINERYLSKRSTIISTNYSIEDLKNYYSERIFSRITSNYKLLKIYGDDIRVKKKLEE